MLFENEYLPDRAWAEETYGYLYFRTPLRAFFLALMGCILFLGVCAFFYDTSAFVYVLIAAAFFCINLLHYRRSVKLHMSRMMEMYGSIPVTKLSVDESGTVRHKASTGAEASFPISAIKRVYVSRHYIFLRSGTNLVFSFRRDGFTVGKEQDFLAFLRTHGVRAKSVPTSEAVSGLAAAPCMLLSLGYLIAALVASTQPVDPSVSMTPAFAHMAASVLFLVPALSLYFLSALTGLCARGGALGIVRASLVALAAILGELALFNGLVGTLICAVLFLGILILEAVSLLLAWVRDKKSTLPRLRD